MIHAVLFCSCCFLMDGVFGVETDEINVSAMEGGFFTLRTGLTEILSDYDIEWRFGSSRTRITRIAAGNVTTHDDERFRDRVQLERQTGDLTITNVTHEHSGVYELSITIGFTVSTKKKTVTVFAPLPVPVISKYSPQCSSSSSGSSVSKGVLLCSVLNVSHVTLSWYKGNSSLSSISVSNLSISLSLPLEVEYQDKNTYSCVLNNPISNQTRHLDITQLCQTPDQYWSQWNEAVIRLVVTAVVGVAAVAAVVVLAYDIKSRRAELERKTKFTKSIVLDIVQEE